MPLATIGIATHITHDPGAAKIYATYLVGHTIVTTILVATVVGPREAIAGIVPNLLINTYNKWLYLKAFAREWVLDSHYTGWTGRHGHIAIITPINPERVVLLVWWTIIATAACSLAFGAVLPPFWFTITLLGAVPWLAMYSVPPVDCYKAT